MEETRPEQPQRIRARTSKRPGIRSGLRARERVGLTMQAVGHASSQIMARVRRSHLIQWRSRLPSGDELLMAPPDLRVADPSFATELATGNFGLAGQIADLRGRSPFAYAPASEEWARELHGFGWLRHLDAARSEETEALSQQILREWLQRGRRDKVHAWPPEVTGRRVISWLSHSGLLLDGAGHNFYAAVLRSLGDQAAQLSVAWADAPDGHPRLLALTGLVLADLCIAGHDRQLAQSEKLLSAEIERQVLSDGCHADRNPATCVEILLDLLPLHQCFLVQSRRPNAAVLRAIKLMMPMLRHARLGDGTLARFNGVGATDHDALATVLAYDKGQAPLPTFANPSGYARLERGTTVIVVDAGAPPPLPLAQAAHAGCLSFELSSADHPLLVNNGVPSRLAEPRLRAAARATASHNTLCLEEQSSSQLVRRQRAGHRHGTAPIQHPDHVTCKVEDTDAVLALEASHDGYVERRGLLHRRTLKLATDGSRLEGIDALVPVKGVLRFAWDLPFAIHFHVHPAVDVLPGGTFETADLLLGSGEHWRLSATGAALSIEPSLHCALASGPRAAQQVVLRATCHGEARVVWVLERMPPGSLPEDVNVHPSGVGQSLGERLAQAGAGFDLPQEGGETDVPD